jgi:hypothetical protein
MKEREFDSSMQQELITGVIGIVIMHVPSGVLVFPIASKNPT